MKAKDVKGRYPVCELAMRAKAAGSRLMIMEVYLELRLETRPKPKRSDLRSLPPVK